MTNKTGRIRGPFSTLSQPHFTARVLGRTVYFMDLKKRTRIEVNVWSLGRGLTVMINPSPFGPIDKEPILYVGPYGEEGHPEEGVEANGYHAVYRIHRDATPNLFQLGLAVHAGEADPAVLVDYVAEGLDPIPSHFRRRFLAALREV